MVWSLRTDWLTHKGRYRAARAAKNVFFCQVGRSGRYVRTVGQLVTRKRLCHNWKKLITTNEEGYIARWGGLCCKMRRVILQDEKGYVARWGGSYCKMRRVMLTRGRYRAARAAKKITKQKYIQLCIQICIQISTTTQKFIFEVSDT